MFSVGVCPQANVPASLRAARREINSFLFWCFFFFFLPVTPFAAGIAAGGSGSGAVAFGLARIFSRQASHVLVGVGSPHSADRKAGNTRQGTQLNYAMRGNGVVEVNSQPRNVGYPPAFKTTAFDVQNVRFSCAADSLTVPLVTMERLHQQSIGQRALSPNPACGRNVYSKPKTVIPFWRACVVCWLKSRAEQRAEWGGDCSLLAPEESW